MKPCGKTIQEQFWGSIPQNIFGLEEDDAKENSLKPQQRFISNMISLCIKNPLTTDAKHNLRAHKTSDACNIQDYGAAMFFFIVKIVHPATCVGLSDIKEKLESMKLSRFKHDITRSIIYISV